MKKAILVIFLSAATFVSYASLAFAITNVPGTPETSEASPESVVSTQETWVEMMLNNATFESDKPTCLFLSNTAYWAPRGGLSALIDLEGKGYSELALSTRGRHGIFVGLSIPVNKNYLYLFGFKWAFMDETMTLPAAALVVKGGASQSTKYGYEPFTGKTYEKGIEAQDELTIKLIFSKQIRENEHFHFGFGPVNGCSEHEEDGDEEKENWHTYVVSFGYDALLGSFRPIFETSYDPPGQFQKSIIGVRGPIDWWLQFQLGHLSLIDYESSWSDGAVLFGIYCPGI